MNTKYVQTENIDAVSNSIKHLPLLGYCFDKPISNVTVWMAVNL